jgi:hypothetical protein
LILAVIRDLADWRIRRGRNLYQVHATFASQPKRLERLHHPQLTAFFVNHPDFASPNPFVNANPLNLPEIPISDKSP